MKMFPACTVRGIGKTKPEYKKQSGDFCVFLIDAIVTYCSQTVYYGVSAATCPMRKPYGMMYN
jgi:hypothetical protein